MEQFPPNSHRSKREPKRVERVTSDGAVRRRRQPLGRKVRQTFFNEDAHMALEYTIANTVIPAIKDMMLDAVNSSLERVFYGDDRRRGRRSPMSTALGHVNYGGMYQSRGPAPKAQQLTRPSRMRHAFDDIVIESRGEAEEVLDRMYEIVSQYDEVSVADLYELTGIASSHTDKKWGWEDLRGSRVGRIRGGGYLLELPEPISLG